MSSSGLRRRVATSVFVGSNPTIAFYWSITQLVPDQLLQLLYALVVKLADTLGLGPSDE